MYALLTKAEQNPKTNKGLKKGYMTFPLHLAPADLSGHEVCSQRSPGCSLACLNTAGRGIFDSVQAARIRRTKLFFADRAAFMLMLAQDISKASRYAEVRGYKLAIRLNATSDIPFHRVPIGVFASIMEMFPEVQFYDYTKVSKRLTREQLPVNYHLTFSLSETNEAEANAVIAAGHNVSVVFRNRALVESLLGTQWHGAPVIDGDETDLRFLEPDRSIVALYAKGRAKSDTSGFVRDC